MSNPKHKLYKGIAKTGRYSEPDDIVRTPYWLIEKMIELANIQQNENILDPCFGDGRIMQTIINKYMPDSRYYEEYNLHIKGLEINKIEFEKYSSFLGSTENCDFLDDFQEFNEIKYDCIIMNPPFSGLQAWKFVEKGLRILSENGRIISIVPSYILTQNRDRAKSINKHLHSIYALPKDAFKESGKDAIDGFLCEFRKKTDNRCGAVYPE